MRSWTKGLCAGLVLSTAAAAAAPLMFGPDDTRLVLGYALTLDKLKALGDTYAQMDGACDAALNKKRLDILRASSVARDIAQVGADPQLMAYFTRHGLTADDAVLMPLVLIGAALAQSPADAAKYNMPVSPDQIAFYRAHPFQTAGIDWNPHPCKT